MISTETDNPDGSGNITVLDASGNKTESVDVAQDGTRTDSVYDPTTGNLTSQSVFGPGGPTQAWHRYLYDYNGTLYEIDSYANDVLSGKAVFEGKAADGTPQWTVTGTGSDLAMDGVYITAAGAQTTLEGNNDEVIGGTINFNSSYAAIQMAWGTLILAGTGDVVTLNGGITFAQTLTLGREVGVTIETAAPGNADAFIQAGAGNAVTIAGGGLFNFTAAGDAAGGQTSDGEATGISLLADGVEAKVTGSGNTITTVAGNTIYANGNDIIVSGGSASSQQVTTIIGSGNTIEAADHATLSFSGSPGSNEISGNDLELVGLGTAVQLGDGASVTVVGSAGTISASSGNAITLVSGSYTVSATGLSGGAANDGQADGIMLGQNITATIIGSGNAVTAGGNDTLTASGVSITLTGSGTAITGDNNAISATGITVNGVSGTHDTLTGDNDTIVGPYSFSSSDHGPLTLIGTGYTLGQQANVTLAGASATVTGRGVGIAADADTSITVSSAASATVTKNGGNAVVVESGGSLVIYGSSDGDSNTVDAAGSTDIQADYATIVLSGSGSSIEATNSVIQADDGLSLVLNGGGNPNTTHDSLSGNDETLTCGYAGVTLTGTGDIVAATDSLITLQTGESASVSGGSSTINAVAGDSLTVTYTSGTAANVINANNVVAGSLTRDGKATGITLDAQVGATINGSGNTITSLGNNVIAASNDTLLASGNGSLLTGNSDTIQFGSSATNMQIKGSGETLIMSDQTTLASLTASAANGGSDLVLSDSATGSQITLTGMLSQPGMGAQQVILHQGGLSALQLANLATTGTSGSDTMYGWAFGGNTFDGKGGTDVAIGRGNGDTFVFDQGYGSLEINETDPGTSPNNVLKLGTGITASSLALSTLNGSDLLVSDGTTGDQITLDGMLTSDSKGIQTIQLADGTTMTRSQLLSLPINVNGSADISQTLTGTSSDNVFDSHGGNDVEMGAGGNDTYILQPGYSGITIDNGVSTNTAASGDLKLGGVSPDNVWFQQVGNNLQVSVLGSTTEATIDNWFSNTYSQLSEVTVSGGSSGSLVLDSQTNQLIQAMATFSANNPGFDITSSANPAITDPTLLAAVNSAWHH